MPGLTREHRGLAEVARILGQEVFGAQGDAEQRIDRTPGSGTAPNALQASDHNNRALTPSLPGDEAQHALRLSDGSVRVAGPGHQEAR